MTPLRSIQRCAVIEVSPPLTTPGRLSRQGGHHGPHHAAEQHRPRWRLVPFGLPEGGVVHPRLHSGGDQGGPGGPP